MGRLQRERDTEADRIERERDRDRKALGSVLGRAEVVAEVLDITQITL